MKRKRNANKCFRVAISGLLMATLVAPQMTISVFASGTGKASSNAQTEAQMSAEAVAQSNRESGLVGFENEYALSDTNNPVSVIVEFVHQPVALVEAIADANGERVSKSTKKLKALEEQDKEEFYEALEGIDYSVKYEYDDVMNGVSVTLPESYVDDIAALDCVFAVYPNETYDNVTTPDNEANFGIAEASDDAGNGAVTYALENEETHYIQGMADSRAYLHTTELGLTGRGVTVGVIDTGIDYNHPDLKDVFADTLPNGNTPKAEELLNGKFVGRNYISNGNASNDPMDDHGHGTHVSGTIAARGTNTTGISAQGIAPEATLVSYKAINSKNSCQLDDILAAMSDAVTDGCKIISMSLGWSNATDATHGTNLGLNSLALQNPDVLFVVCAGNSGSNSYTLWSPGTSPMALTVANAMIPSENRLLTLNHDGRESQLRLIRSDWSNTVTEEAGKYTINALTADEFGNYKMVLLPTVDGNGLGTGTQAEFENFLQNQVSIISTEDIEEPEIEKPVVTEPEAGLSESEETESEVPESEENLTEFENEEEIEKTGLAAESETNALPKEAAEEILEAGAPATMAAEEYAGTLFVVQRGESFDSTVARILSTVGKGAILVINSENRQNDFESISWWQGYYQNYLPVFTIQYEEGQELLQGLNVGEIYDFQFTDAAPLSSIAAGGKGCKPAFDTSIGPVSKTYDMKPDLAAPGTAIVSTVYKDYNGPSDNYNYAYSPMNGTSMATPHVSAIAALLREKAPNLTALEIKSILVNTADRSAFGDNVSRLAVGAGMIDPSAAVKAVDEMVYMTAENDHAYNNSSELSTIVKTPTISMEMIPQGTAVARTEDVTVTNKGNANHTYNITLENTIYTTVNGSSSSMAAGNIFSTDVSSVTVPAGGQATFKLTVSLSAEAAGGCYETTVVLTDGNSRLISPAGVFVYEAATIRDDALDTDYTFIQNAVVSGGEYMQLADYNKYGSDRTFLHYSFYDTTVDSWQPLLYSADGELIGVIDGTYGDIGQNYYYWNTIGDWYAPCTFDEDGTIHETGNWGKIPEGAYKLAFLLRKAGAQPKVITIADFYIDDTLPELKLADTEKWTGKLVGDNVVYNGNIYDEGTEEMKNLGINSAVDERVFGNTTSQKDNVVILRIGEKDYRAEIDENGDFTVTVPKTEATGNATIYFGDHFLPQGSEGRPDDFYDGFEPEGLSYTVETSVDTVPWMTAYAYRAANMATTEIELVYSEEEEPKEPGKPEEPGKPVSPEKPSGTDKPDGENKPSTDKKADKATNTGDQNTITLYVILCCVSLCGIAGHVLYMRKKKIRR